MNLHIFTISNGIEIGLLHMIKCALFAACNASFLSCTSTIFGPYLEFCLPSLFRSKLGRFRNFSIEKGGFWVIP